MARTATRLPEPYRAGRVAPIVDFHVSELAADGAGAMPPWGDIELPLPLERLNYRHPGPEDRPNLAGA